jgi:hypothetical protein
MSKKEYKKISNCKYTAQKDLNRLEACYVWFAGFLLLMFEGGGGEDATYLIHQ